MYVSVLFLKENSSINFLPLLFYSFFLLEVSWLIIHKNSLISKLYFCVIVVFESVWVYLNYRVSIIHHQHKYQITLFIDQNLSKIFFFVSAIINLKLRYHNSRFTYFYNICLGDITCGIPSPFCNFFSLLFFLSQNNLEVVNLFPTFCWDLSWEV